MPRIRTIKPELFDDPDIGALSPLARWLFVGLLTQADAAGRLADEPARLKLRLLGFDAKADANRLLQELHDAEMVIRYEVDGKRYLQVRSFAKHQHVHPKEPISQIPAYSDRTREKHGKKCFDTDKPSFSHDDLLDSGLLTLDSGGLTLEAGHGSPAPGPEPAAAAPPAPRPADLQALWNTTTTPPLPRCLDLSDDRVAKARVRLREHPLDWWRPVVTRIEASAFCRGQNDRGWVATLDWLLANPSNALKVLEGKYDNRAPLPASRGEPRVSDEAILADLEAQRALRHRRPS